jgi:RNA polymerase sigma factor (sigma-70 family)
MRAEAVRLRVANERSNLQLRGMAQEFDRLFSDEYARVVSIAYRVLADRAEAEDVAQEVFLDFHLRHAKSVNYAPAWLHRAAANKALNRIRSRKRREAREATQAQGDEPAPEALVEQQEERRLLRDALRRLPAKSASVLALRYSGLKYIEVADALGVSVDQVGTLLRRAEMQLRKEVER